MNSLLNGQLWFNKAKARCQEIWIERNPDRLLIALELMFIIGATLINLVLPRPFQTEPRLALGMPESIGHILAIVLFATMGLKRPKHKLSLKILYTCVEFALICVPVLLVSRLPSVFPPLHLVIIIRSCSMFKKLGQVITMILANLSFILFLLNEKLDFVGLESANIDQLAISMHSARLNALSAFMLIGLFILLLVNAYFSVQRSRQELAYAHEQLRQYSLRIEDQATLQERNRIAREIHDALGHVLTAQGIQLDTVYHFWTTDPDRAFRALTEAKRLSSQALYDVRQAISTLRVDPLQGLSLEDGLVRLIQTFDRTTGILSRCTIRLSVSPPGTMKACIYRIIQEALTNVAKHSHAAEVNIYLQSTATQLNLLIQDNGIGFDPQYNESGFGLRGMEERTLALGGLFRVVSQPGGGCKIMAQIPLIKLL